MMITAEKEFYGKVAYFNPEKMCGFIVYQGPLGENQIIPIVYKYFFHVARVVICERAVANISTGMLARFNVSKVPPKPGNLPYATEVELYEPTEPAVGLAALSALTEAQ